MPDNAPQRVPEPISVVIPTKNRADLLGLTLRSVTEQSLPPAEIIVADDGSTDDTSSVVKAAGARYLLNDGGGWGAAGARNAGLRAATGEYVSFIDSDDLMHPRALERLHAALQARSDATFAFGRALTASRGPGGWVPDGVIGPQPLELDDLLCSLFARNSVPSGGSLVRRAPALEIGGFDERIHMIEDHAFWLSLARRGRPEFVPEIVCVYRRHGGNRMSTVAALKDDARITGVASEDPRVAPCLPRRLGVTLCEAATDALHRRRPGELLPLVRRLLLRQPHRIQIARAAVGHWRVRRALSAAGRAALGDDRELRDWLDAY